MRSAHSRGLGSLERGLLDEPAIQSFFIAPGRD
jgi:hypothetical protein